MSIPEYIQAYGIHAERLAHFDALIPILAGNTGVVKLGCLDYEWLAVEHKRAFAGFEGALGGFGCLSRCCACRHTGHEQR